MKQPYQRTQLCFFLCTFYKILQLICGKPSAFLNLLHSFCVLILYQKLHYRTYSELQVFLRLLIFIGLSVRIFPEINLQSLFKLSVLHQIIFLSCEITITTI